jgi:hypothetical protein
MGQVYEAVDKYEEVTIIKVFEIGLPVQPTLLHFIVWTKTTVKLFSVGIIYRNLLQSAIRAYLG